MVTSTLVERILSKYPNMQLDIANELAERAIEHFCMITKRTVVPARAGWLLVDIALAFAKQGAEGVAADTPDAPVSAIKRGDTTIQYDTSSSAAAMYTFDAINARIRRYAVVRAR